MWKILNTTLYYISSSTLILQSHIAMESFINQSLKYFNWLLERIQVGFDMLILYCGKAKG